MTSDELIQRMKDFGIRGVRDASVHLFVKPELLAEDVMHEVEQEREACAKLFEDEDGSFHKSTAEAWRNPAAAIRKRK